MRELIAKWIFGSKFYKEKIDKEVKVSRYLREKYAKKSYVDVKIEVSCLDLEQHIKDIYRYLEDEKYVPMDVFAEFKQLVVLKEKRKPGRPRKNAV